MAAGISVQYQGKLRCKATRGPSGQAVLTDIGADHGGQGEYLSPIEMTVAALATCAMSMLAVAAERNGIDVSAVQTTANFDMATEPGQRRIGSVQLTIKLPGTLRLLLITNVFL